MSKHIVKPSELLEMIDSDMPGNIGHRKSIHFTLLRPDDKTEPRWTPRRSRCDICKTMIETNEICVQVYDPDESSYNKSKNFHFRPCFSHKLAKIVKELSNTIDILLQFQEKYDLPNK